MRFIPAVSRVQIPLSLRRMDAGIFPASFSFRRTQKKLRNQLTHLFASSDSGAIFSFNYSRLQVRFDLLDHLRILFVRQVGTARIHLEDAAPLILIFILRNQVHVQMASGISVCAIVYLIRMERCVDGIRCACHVCEKCISLLVADVYDLAHMIFVCNDTSSRMALLLDRKSVV